jgi:hypothetical protein
MAGKGGGRTLCCLLYSSAEVESSIGLGGFGKSLRAIVVVVNSLVDNARDAARERNAKRDAIEDDEEG